MSNIEQTVRLNFNRIHHSCCNLINSRQVSNDKNGVKVPCRAGEKETPEDPFERPHVRKCLR